MSKDQAISLLRSDDFTEKKGILWNIQIFYHVWKMFEETITLGDIDIEKQNFIIEKIKFC